MSMGRCEDRQAPMWISGPEGHVDRIRGRGRNVARTLICEVLACTAGFDRDAVDETIRLRDEDPKPVRLRPEDVRTSRLQPRPGRPAIDGLRAQPDTCVARDGP
jgi:hypothetical protein